MYKHKFTFSKFLTPPFLLIFFIFASCEKEDFETSLDNEIPVEAQATLEYFDALGYSKEDFTYDAETESLFFEDFAVPIGYENIPKTDGNGEIQAKNQNYPNAFVNYNQSRNIEYYIERGFPSNQINPMAWAAYHWSRVSPNINIRRTYTRSRADIYIGYYRDSRDVAWARAGLPTGNGYVGNWLRLNLARGHNNPDHDANDKMALLMHELGHNLGFLHSDQTAGYNIPGTADAAWHSRNTCGSIMRSSVFTCGWRTSGRSAWSTSDWRAVGWAYKLY